MNPSDKELLELAAKAAGLPLKFGGDWHNVGAPHVEHKSWNPLTEDGDAFRLAVKLNIRLLDIGSHIVEVSALVDRVNDVRERMVEVTNGCIVEATRRAIVRAAAETGRAML